jgi:hypothetical protein
MDTWILQMLRRKYRNQLVVWGLVIAVGVLIVFLNTRYIDNFVRGPFTMGASELAQVGDASTAPHFFVKVAGSRAMDTGLQEVTQETENDVVTSRKVTSNYYALQVGEKLLIVKSTGGTMRLAEGALQPMSSDLESNLFSSPEMQQARTHFYPLYLDAASSFRAGGYWAIAIGLAFLTLLAWKARPAWRGFEDPGSHPLAARVGKWGSPVDTAAAIEREWRAPGTKRIGEWTLTERYLVQSALFRFNVLRFEDLLWAHKKVIKHSIDLIPTGKTYEAIVHCYGGTAELPGSQKKVDEMLQEFGRRVPWAVVGFSAEIQQLFVKQNRDFCAAVEERRRTGPTG